MNEVISPEIVELIRQTSTSASEDINEKIRVIISDLVQLSEAGQTMFSMFENLSNEKDASDERVRQYAIIASNTLKEFSKIQDRQNNENNNNINLGSNQIINDENIRDIITNTDGRFQNIISQFLENIVEKINTTETRISNMSNSVSNSKIQINNLLLLLSQIATTLSCSPQDIIDKAISLRNDNSNCRQMLSLLIQNINGQNNNFQSLDSLLEQLGIENSNIQSRLSQYFESFQQIKEISEILHADPQNIRNEINRLIELSKNSSKILDSVPQIKEISEILHIDPRNIKVELNRLIQISNETPKLLESSQQQINEISNMLHTNPQNIKIELNKLTQVSNEKQKLLESMQQQINEISDMLHTNQQNIKNELSRLIDISNSSPKLLQSDQQLKEISEMLHTSPQNIKNELNKLIAEASKPAPQIPDTTNLENEISRLRRENQFLSDSNQQITNERDNLIHRIAIQQAQLAPKLNPARLTYTHYNYLASISPTPLKSSNNDFSVKQEEFDQAMRSKNDQIAQLNYQLQESIKSLSSMQENSTREINMLKDQVNSLKIENVQKDSQNIKQQTEINKLRGKIDSLPQSELIRSLSNFFGGCANEDEILNKVINMKNEILKLQVQISSNMKSVSQNPNNAEDYESKAFQLKKQLNQATDKAESLQEQVSSLKSDNNNLISTNNTLNQQIQQFRDNETEMKSEITSCQKKIRESSRACERLQSEFDLASAQLNEIKGKYELFENESDKLLTSINKIATKIAAKQMQNQSGKPSEAAANLQKMCESLQLVFMQYTMSDFSSSEKVVSDLLNSIEEVEQSGGSSSNESSLTNQIMKEIITSKASSFFQNIASKMSAISQQLSKSSEQFSTTRNEIIQIIGDQQRDLQDYIENDYAIPYASLNVAYKQLQDRFNAVTKNMDMSQNMNNQFQQFEYQQMPQNNNQRAPIQSRFQNSTPPRNASSRGSRSSIQSPSEIVLDRTIQQNYNRSRLYQ